MVIVDASSGEVKCPKALEHLVYDDDCSFMPWGLQELTQTKCYDAYLSATNMDNYLIQSFLFSGPLLLRIYDFQRGTVNY